MNDLDVTEKVPRAFDTEAPAPAPLIGISMPGGPEIVPLSARRAASGTKTRFAALPPPLPQRANRGSTAPPIGFPIVRRDPTLPPPIPLRATGAIATPPLPMPMAASVVAVPGFDVDVSMDENDVDTDDDPIDLAPVVRDTDDDNVDFAPPKTRNLAAMIGIGAGVGVVGLLLAIALGGSSKPAAVAKVAPAAHKFTEPVLATPTVTVPAPVAVPAPITVPVAPAPAPAIVAVATPPAELAKPATDLAIPITSNPVGAIVTLIDDGDATVVGRTPVIAVVDPARSYEIVVAMHGRPTKIQRLVLPRGTTEVTVDLAPAHVEQAAPAPAPAKHVAELVPAPAKHVAELVPAPTPRPAKVAKVATAPAPVAAAGDTGTLMVSSKPPCNIAIDGKVTKMVTPQRAIALSPGPHSITLTNAQQKIAKTVAVRITAKQPTKLIQDFTNP